MGLLGHQGGESKTNQRCGHDSEVRSQPRHYCLPPCCLWYNHKMVPRRCSHSTPVRLNMKPNSQQGLVPTKDFSHWLAVFAQGGETELSCRLNENVQAVDHPCFTHSGSNSDVWSACQGEHTDPPSWLPVPSLHFLASLTELYEELNKSPNRLNEIISLEGTVLYSLVEL